MKLFKLAMWRMAAAMVVILTAWAAFFYMAVMEEVNDEVDDSLEDYAETLMIRSLSGEEMPSSNNGSINMLWVADITYIDTDEGVCYLHLLTDAFTHEIIGWTLSESLVAENTLETLEQAVSMFRKADLSHLIHHSDRGVQYCCNRYVERLQELKVTP